jgi:hypothetical protein
MPSTRLLAIAVRCIFPVLAAAALAGCVSNPVPDGYVGPLAHIDDSMTRRGSTSANFFYVAKVNGHRIQDSLTATDNASYGRGATMVPAIIGRDVPAQPMTLTIVGRTHYTMPFLELVNRIYEVSGDIAFTPLPNHAYLVKGELGDDHSAVWIVDRETETPVGDKVEIKGSARLSILEK